MSVIFIPCSVDDLATRLPITFCGCEPVPTLWRPSRLRSISGFTPIVLCKDYTESTKAVLMIGRPFLMWSFRSFQVLLYNSPAVTGTICMLRILLMLLLHQCMCVGAAQESSLCLDPDALTSPATSAAAFAKLLPPSRSCLHMLLCTSITYSYICFFLTWALRTA